MPEEKQQTQVNAPSDDPDIVLDTDTTTPEPVLPDSAAQSLPKESETIDAIKAEYEKLKAVTEAKETASKGERERYEKMLADTQRKMHEATQALAAAASKNGEQAPQRAKGETFEQYLERVTELYENDPKAGFKKVVTDMAVEIENARNYATLQGHAAQENAVKKALEKIPGYKEKLQALKQLDEDMPELADLPEDKKLIILEKLEASKQPDAARFAGVAGGSARVRPKPVASKDAWVNDPEIQREARRFGFASKDELLKYASMTTIE